MSFDALGLTPELLRAVADQGYTEPTPVQRESIPAVLAGRDILAGAQTGTGKTAAFVLPMLQLLNAERTPGWKSNGAPEPGRDQRNQHDPRGAAHSPDPRPRPHPDPRARAPGRGERPDLRRPSPDPLDRDLRRRRLRAPDRATCGPAPRSSSRPRAACSTTSSSATSTCPRLEFLVLDEADRMLDMGFIRDIRKIIALLPAKRQNLLFSATFSDEIRRLAGGILHDPVMVQVTPRNSAVELVTPGRPSASTASASASCCRRSSGAARIEQALVFTRTKHGANRLAEQLERDGINAAAIHGNKSQGQRVRALDDFKAGRVDILVATDIAARGLDIEDLPHVVNYELPMVPEDYVHRIGRTGRAENDGDAISLVCVDEAPLLARHRATARPDRSRPRSIPGFEPDRNDPRGADPPAVGRAAVRQSVARRRPAGHPVRSAWRRVRPPRPWRRSGIPPRSASTAARARDATVRGRVLRARTSIAVAASPARAGVRTTTAARGRASTASVVRLRPEAASATARVRARAGPVAESGWTATATRADAAIVRATTAAVDRAPTRDPVRADRRAPVRAAFRHSPASDSPERSAAANPCPVTGRCATTGCANVTRCQEQPRSTPASRMTPRAISSG